MVYENVWMITIACQQSVFQRWHSEKHLSTFITHKMAAKASWHRNYVTVTLCIEWRAAFPMTFEWHFKITFFSYSMSSCTALQLMVSARCVVHLRQSNFFLHPTHFVTQPVMTCARLSVREYISGTTRPVFALLLMVVVWLPSDGRCDASIMYFRFYGLTSYLHSADVSRLLSACKCNVSEIPVSEVCRIVDIVCSEWRHLSSYATAD